nr:MAG TPA: hypothetical protein [Caudoviricetes sp.]
MYIDCGGVSHHKITKHRDDITFLGLTLPFTLT